VGNVLTSDNLASSGTERERPASADPATTVPDPRSLQHEPRFPGIGTGPIRVGTVRKSG
jgi:hypothetical protein